MPFIDILAHEELLDDPAELAANLTEALASAWDISPDIVSVFLTPVGPAYYTHAGRTGSDRSTRRLFLKLHAFPREADEKRAAAQAFVAVFAARGVPPENVITYFLDRAPAEVAHGGTLAADAAAS